MKKNLRKFMREGERNLKKEEKLQWLMPLESNMKDGKD
jgi:hypothetical protein